MFRDHDEFNAVVDAEHAKMRDFLRRRQQKPSIV